MGPDGNNQESSSEAINAWVGLILWGELKGDRALRDLGVWLYTSEIEAIQHYWFDLYKLVLPKEYKNVEVSMLFGGKYAHNTWWTDEPRQIHGINLLPITTASMYLGRDPDFILRNLEAMDKESEIFKSRGKRADPPDIWGDIFLKYRALAQPQEALAQWQRWGSVEFGETRTHTLHWLLTLNERGTPVLDVTADTPFYGVFRNASGQTTYWAYNFSSQTRRVQFSDGQSTLEHRRRAVGVQVQLPQHGLHGLERLGRRAEGILVRGQLDDAGGVQAVFAGHLFDRTAGHIHRQAGEGGIQSG